METFIKKNFLKKTQEKAKEKKIKTTIKAMQNYINSGLVNTSERNIYATSYTFDVDMFRCTAGITMTKEDVKNIFLNHIKPDLLKAGYKVEEKPGTWICNIYFNISWED